MGLKYNHKGRQPATSTKTSCRRFFLLTTKISNRTSTIRSPITPPTIPSTKPIFEVWDPPPPERLQFKNSYRTLTKYKASINAQGHIDVLVNLEQNGQDTTYSDRICWMYMGESWYHNLNGYRKSCSQKKKGSLSLNHE
jgi:hypothetical protein